MTTPTSAEYARQLAVIWGNNPPDRYIPRATLPTPGSTAWQVWDRKEARFLTNAEVAALTFDNVCEQHHEG